MRFERSREDDIMVQPIWVLQSGSEPADELCAEILRCEGFPWFEALPLEDFREAPREVRLLIVVGAPISAGAAEYLAAAVARGIMLIAVTPAPTLAAAFGLTVGAPMTDASLTVQSLANWEHGPLSLLCPDQTSRPLAGGLALAQLRDTAGRARGAALAEVHLGRGQAWLFGYDLCQAVAGLRHGTGALDERPSRDMGSLYGPRHIYGFFELSNKVPRNVPVADLHQDLLRTLVLQALANTALPRLWHFPGGAPALWFVKGDGCGEYGADQLVEIAERYAAYVSFYRPQHSRYAGGLMRSWHERGHGISIEANLNDLTQTVGEAHGTRVRRGRSAAEINRDWLPAIRTQLQAHRDSFQQETGLETETVCIHSCQWTGEPLARVLRELGWYTPVHFISHDPRMRLAERYGPYMIASALPLRYFERGVGVLDVWHMPAQWDESQTIGLPADLVKARPADWRGWQMVPRDYHGFYSAIAPGHVDGFVGLTAETYGAQLARFARDAAQRWHGVQISNFHPLYAAGPQDHPRASRVALQIALREARAAGCRFDNLEHWARFFRRRAGVRLVTWRSGTDEDEFVTLEAPESVEELALLVPDLVTAVQSMATGEAIPLQAWWLEGRWQTGTVVKLNAGQPLALRLVKGRTRVRRGSRTSDDSVAS
jgi:hypothetical protein